MSARDSGFVLDRGARFRFAGCDGKILKVIRVVAPWLALTALASFLIARNWAAWTNPLVDFGRELYIPWRLVEGQVLYRDIAYLDGPFSPYWNALCFTLFPVAMRTLEVANIAVIACTSALLFALLRRLIGTAGPHPLGSTVVASSGVALFLCVFAVNLLGTGGNMNWLAPYSHGITHGVALALASIWLFARHLESGRSVDLSLAGLALGLCALTKPEVFAAAGLAISVGMLASLRTPPASADSPLRRMLVLVGSFVLPPVVAIAGLAQAMPFSDALAGALGGWSHLLGSDVQQLPFYRWVMGIDEPVENWMQMTVAAAVWASVLIPALFLSRFLSLRLSNPKWRNRIAAALPLAILALTPWVSDWYAWKDIFRPMAVCFAIAMLISGLQVWRSSAAEAAPRAILELCVAVLALSLLVKIFWKPILDGYAFALLVPGAMWLVFLLLHAVPAAIERRGGDGRMFAWAALAMLVGVSVGCLIDAEPARTGKTIVVGAGGDSFRAQAQRRARLPQRLSRWVDATLPPEATLVVLPEGAIINYLTRRINPTRHLNFLPPELAIFDEKKILEDLETHPPDFVALVHRDTAEYGVPLFGTDYGHDLYAWALRGYERVIQVGSKPLDPRTLRDSKSGWEVRMRRVGPNEADDG